jgi:ParB-like chromosome segregation protein Spo0J
VPRQSQPTKPTHAGEPVITDEVRKVADLPVGPDNARKHSEAQISQIVLSIERFGYVDKMIIRPEGQVIGGHARLEALKRMGRDEAECRVVAGLTEAGYKAMGIALNRIPENSRWDDDILRGVLLDIQESGENAQALGFTPGELSRILAEPDELEVKEIETGPVDDEFWISIRGPLVHQAHALRALQDAMKPFNNVTVEQGTINLG